MPAPGNAHCGKTTYVSLASTCTLLRVADAKTDLATPWGAGLSASQEALRDRCLSMRTSVPRFRAPGEATTRSPHFISNVGVARPLPYTAPPPCWWPDHLRRNLRDGRPRRVPHVCIPGIPDSHKALRANAPHLTKAPLAGAIPRNSPKFGGPRGNSNKGHVVTFPLAAAIFLYRGEFNPSPNIRLPA